MTTLSVQSIAENCLGKSAPLSLREDIFFVYGDNNQTLSLKAKLDLIQGFKHTGFAPTEHGFKFSNTFQNHISIFDITLTFNGRCGGMVYAALDYFNNRMPIPSQTSLPPEGSVLSNYIFSRQLKFTENSIVKWIELTINPFGWRTSEFFNWGLQEVGGRLGELKREIDNGRPAPLGLFNPADLIKHHIVLALGYKGSGSALKIQVYDPNYPNQVKVLRPYPDGSNPRYYYEDFDPNKDTKWLTYFVDLNYRAHDPDL